MIATKMIRPAPVEIIPEPVVIVQPPPMVWKRLPIYIEPELRKGLGDVIRTICKGTGVEMAEIAYKGRHPKAIKAREMIVYLARKHLTCSYPELTHAMGRSFKAHSTSIDCYKRISRRLAGLPVHNGPLCVWFGQEVPIIEALMAAEKELGFAEAELARGVEG